MSEPQETYNLGELKTIDNVKYLVVRYVDSTTLFEDPTTSKIYVENELYVELRNAEGGVRFINLASKKEEARRDAGPIKGVKPYFWKAGL